MTSFPVSRRRVLKGVAAVACLTATQALIPRAALGLTTASPSTRPNIDSLSSQELAVYEYAVGLLRDGAGGRCSHSVSSHPALRGVSAAHLQSASTPWDAEHLELFEKALRVTDPLVDLRRLPFPTGTSRCRASGKEHPIAFERVGSPFVHRSRRGHAKTGHGDVVLSRPH